MSSRGWSIASWVLVSAVASAAPLYAQSSGLTGASGAVVMPNIGWSLSGKTLVHAPDKHSDKTQVDEPAESSPGNSGDTGVAKQSAQIGGMAARSRKEHRRFRPVAKMTVIALTTKAAAARVEAARLKPFPPISPRKSTAPALPTKPIDAAAPAAVRRALVPPTPKLIDTSQELVAAEPLAPRKASHGGGSFGGAVAAAKRLRPVIGILSLAAALAGLVALWWRSIGARSWHARRRHLKPRIMIDLALADPTQDGIHDIEQMVEN